MTRLLFIRHGAIDGLGQRIAGRGGGEKLNSNGRAQVAALGKWLAQPALAAIYSSPQERALETAQALAAASAISVHLESQLDELDFGAWTGKSYAELDRLPEWRSFNALRGCTRMPKGEWLFEVQCRAVACSAHLAQRHRGQTIALVSHGDVIRSALVHYMGAPLEFILRLEISPASVSTVSWADDGPRILAVNFTLPENHFPTAQNGLADRSLLEDIDEHRASTRA